MKKQRIKILFADDDREGLFEVRIGELRDDFGDAVECVFVDHWREAVRIIDEGDTDIVVVDMNFEKYQGLEYEKDYESDKIGGIKVIQHIEEQRRLAKKETTYKASKEDAGTIKSVPSKLYLITGHGSDIDLTLDKIWLEQDGVRTIPEMTVFPTGEDNWFNILGEQLKKDVELFMGGREKELFYFYGPPKKEALENLGDGKSLNILVKRVSDDKEITLKLQKLTGFTFMALAQYAPLRMYNSIYIERQYMLYVEYLLKWQEGTIGNKFIWDGEKVYDPLRPNNNIWENEEYVELTKSRNEQLRKKISESCVAAGIDRNETKWWRMNILKTAEEGTGQVALSGRYIKNPAPN